VIGGTTPAAISGTTGAFSGNVGIGTSSPNYDLTIGGGTNNSLQILSSTTGSSSNNGLRLWNAGASTALWNYDNTPTLFGTNGSEAMRIDSSGNVLVGTTSDIDFNENTNEGIALRGSVPQLNIARTSSFANMNLNKVGTSGEMIRFNANGSDVGSIDTTSTTTSYNTSSDERLKENITDADDASALIDGIQVRQFDWKADGEHQRYGMIAQELDTVAPEAVTKGETEDDMWAVDYSKLVPMLVKEIQDLRKRVAELEGAN